jgi:hypothetical protein
MIHGYAIVNIPFTRETGITGICWLVQNWTIDALVLMKISGISPADYLPQTGLRSLMIFARVIATDVVTD